MIITGHPLILIEPEGSVYIRHEDGRGVSFSSREEFTRVSEISLPDNLIRVAYEPSLIDNAIVTWLPDTSPQPLPDPLYILNNIGVLISRKEDKFFGVDLEEARRIKIEEVLQAGSVLKDAEYQFGADILSTNNVQSLDELEKLSVSAVAMEESNYPVVVIMSNTGADGLPIRQTFTALQVLQYLSGLRRRNEAINQRIQDDIDAVSVLTTVAEIVNYQIV